jgi:hypothetical protein
VFGRNAANGEDLIAAADAAMYQAKRAADVWVIPRIGCSVTLQVCNCILTCE